MKDRSMMYRGAAVCLSWFLFSTLAGCDVVEPARQARADDALVPQIQERMQAFVDAGQIAGAVTLVAHEGQIVHHAAAGYANLEERAPMKPDAIFAIASMTKPVTATAVMILVDEGKLALDEPVSQYIPAFEDLALADGTPATPITLRHLLTHTSGLSSDQRNRGTIDETVAHFAREPLSFQPGSHWLYGPGLTVAGRVVEIVSQSSFDDFVSKRILDPLGMSDTTFKPNGQQQARLAALYRPGPQPGTLEPGSHWLAEVAPDAAPNPSGGLFSTARDMARFYQMIVNGGELDGRRIVSAESVSSMSTIQTGALETGFTDGNGWGLGWCVVRDPQGATAALSPGSFGHGGALGTQGWVDPVRNSIYVLLIQRTDFGNSDASDIRREFQELAREAIDHRSTGTSPATP
jgi:CubicO group peptidase (beta-lactamase class C family)